MRASLAAVTFSPVTASIRLTAMARTVASGTSHGSTVRPAAMMAMATAPSAMKRFIP